MSVNVNSNRYPRTIVSKPRRRDDEEQVQNGLAITPEQMQEMTLKGVPIASQNLGITYDEGYSNTSFDVPMEYQRGVDISDAWEAREDVTKRFNKVYKEASDAFFASQQTN